MRPNFDLLSKKLNTIQLKQTEMIAFLSTSDFPTLADAYKNNTNSFHDGFDHINEILNKITTQQDLAINKLQSYFDNYNGRPGIISNFAFDSSASSAAVHIANWTAAPHADYYTITVEASSTVKYETGPIYDTSYGFDIYTTDGDNKLMKDTEYTFLITAHNKYGTGTTKSETKTTPDK